MKNYFKEGDLFCVEHVDEEQDRYRSDTFLCLAVENLHDNVRNIHGARLQKDPTTKTMTLPSKQPTIICFEESEWNFFDYEGNFKLVMEPREAEDEEVEDAPTYS
jgi:hypothetical protein